MKKWKEICKSILIGSSRSAFVTFLAFLLSYFLLEPLSFSAYSILSSPEKQDVNITDLYAQVANRRPVRSIDQNIILVDIGHADRAEIARIIDQVNFWHPKVIGVDIIFAGDNPADSLLLSALYDAEKLIMPIALEEDAEGGFKIEETPFFYPDDKLGYAACNLPSKFEGGTIREFATSFLMKDGEQILSFPAAVADAYDPQSTNALFKRSNKYETIDYASRDFITLTADDIETDGSMMTGRIVLIGAISDGTDMHSTPINHYMSGLHIHAMSVATILGGHYFDPAFRYPAWIPASLLCFLILLVRELTKAQLTGLITRLMQIFIVYYAIRIGYSLYVDEYRIFDFSYTMLMVSFGLLAGDIWKSVEYIIQVTRRLIIRLFNKINLQTK